MEKDDRNTKEIIIRPAWRGFIRNIIWILIFGLVGVILSTQQDENSRIISIILFGLSIFIFLRLLYKKYSTKIILTGTSIIDNDGLIAINEREVSYTDIRTVKVTQGIMARILNYGTLEIATAGTNEYELQIYRIYNPKKIKSEILNRKSN